MLDALIPFHPRIVHFPIALTLVGALFAALGLLRRRERWLGYGQLSLLLGWVAALAAVVSGLVDQSRAPDDAAVLAAINQHITAGIALVVIVGLALYWPLVAKGRLERSPARWGYLALLALVVILVVVEGWLGGRLVYDLRVGIR